MTSPPKRATSLRKRADQCDALAAWIASIINAVPAAGADQKIDLQQLVRCADHVHHRARRQHQRARPRGRAGHRRRAQGTRSARRLPLSARRRPALPQRARGLRHRRRRPSAPRTPARLHTASRRPLPSAPALRRRSRRRPHLPLVVRRPDPAGQRARRASATRWSARTIASTKPCSPPSAAWPRCRRMTTSR